MLNKDYLNYLTDYQRDLYKRGIYSDADVQKIVDENTGSLDKAVATGPLTPEEERVTLGTQGYLEEGELSSGGAAVAASREEFKRSGRGLKGLAVDAAIGKRKEFDPFSIATNPVAATLKAATGFDTSDFGRSLGRMAVGGDEAADEILQDMQRLRDIESQIAAGRQERIGEAEEKAGLLMQKVIKHAPSITDVGTQLGLGLASRGALTPALAGLSAAKATGSAFEESGDRDRAVAFGTMEGLLEKVGGGKVFNTFARQWAQDTAKEVGTELLTEAGQIGYDVAKGNQKFVPQTMAEWGQRAYDVIEGATLLGGAASTISANSSVRRVKGDLKDAIDRGADTPSFEAAKLDSDLLSQEAEKLGLKQGDLFEGMDLYGDSSKVRVPDVEDIAGPVTPLSQRQKGSQRPLPLKMQPGQRQPAQPTTTEVKTRNDDVLTIDKKTGTVTSRIEERAKVEAANTVAKEEANVEKARKEQHANLRRKSKATAVTEADKQGLKGKERAEFLATKIVEFEKANPYSTFKATPKGEPKPTAAPAPAAKTPPPLPTKPDEPKPTSIKDTVAQLKEDDVFSIGPDGTKSIVTAKTDPKDIRFGSESKEAIYKRLLRNDKTTRAARDAVISGKVRVVARGDQLPTDNPARSAAGGYFDGKQVYIVGENVSNDTIIPTMIHEVKHYYDEKKGNGSRDYRNMVGDKANAKFIEKMRANPDNAVVARALGRYNKAVEKAGPQDEAELVTYFVEEFERARKGGNTVLGTAKGLASDILSAVKTGYANATGQEIDVSFNDMAYVSRKLLEKVSTDKNTKVGKKGLFNLIGPNARKFKDYTEKGVIFEGAVDKLPRAEIDSSQAVIDAPSSDKLRKTGKSGSVRADSLLPYPDLYTNYPQLASVKIRLLDEGSKVGGRADFDNSEIFISPKMLNDPKKLRGVLLHELQHFIQRIEGFAGGASTSDFMSPEEIIAYDKASDELTAFINSVGIEDIIGLIPRVPASKIREDGIGGVLRAAKDLDPDSLTREERELLSRYNPLREKFNETFKSRKAAQDKYHKVAGEAEARAVSDRADLTTSERAETDFYRSLDNGLTKEDLVDVADPKTGSRFQEARGRERLAAGPDKFANRVADLQESRKAAGGKFSIGDVDISHPAKNKFGTRDPASIDTVSIFGNIVHPESTIARITSIANKLRGKTRVPGGVKGSGQAINADNNSRLLRMMNLANATRAAVDSTANPDKALADLQAYALIKTREERVAAFHRLQPKYPEVMKLYNDMRKQIVLYSQEIAGGISADPNRMTELDKQRVAVIQREIGNYITRTYAINAPRKVASQHLKSLKNTDAGKEIVKRAREYIHKHIVSIPKELNKTQRDHLEVLYDFWVPSTTRDVSSLETEDLRAAIEKVRATATAEKVDLATENTLDDLMTIGQRSKLIGKAARLFRGSTQDLTIISQKKDVPPAIRELWGEQTDPIMSAFTTLAKQGEFISRMHEQQRLLEEYDGKYFFDNSTSAPGDLKLVKLDGDAYGPLSGKFTTPEIAEELSLKRQAANNLIEYIGAWQDSVATGEWGSIIGDSARIGAHVMGKLGGWAKWTTVVANPVNWGLNFAGSGLQLMMNGNFVPKHLPKAMSAAFSRAPGAYYKAKTDEDIVELVRTNMLDSVFAGELQRAEFDALVNKFYKKGAKSRWHKTKSWITDRYAATDLYAKIANYYAEKDFVTKFYKELGKELTSSEIEQITSERVQSTNFSFNRAWWPAKVLEQGGITNYMTYNAEVFRTVGGNIALAAKDFMEANKIAKTNPKAAAMLRFHAGKRAAGVGAALTLSTELLKIGAGAIGSMLGAPEEDEKEQELKGLAMPNYADDAVPMLIGKDGVNRDYFDVGRLDPYGPLTETARGLIKAAREEDMDKVGETIKGLFILNKALDQASQIAGLSGTVRRPSIANATPGVNDRAKELAMETLGMSEDTYNKAARSLETLTPSIFNSVIPGMLEAGGMSDETGEAMPETTMRQLAEGLGFKPIRYRPEKDLPNSARSEYASKLNDARSELTDYIQSQSTINPESLKERLLDATILEQDMFSDTRDSIRAAELAGVRRSQIAELLKQGKDGTTTGLNKEQIANLTRNRFKPTVLPEKSIDALKTRELAIAKASTNRANRAKVGTKYRLVTREVNRFNRTYKSLLEE